MAESRSDSEDRVDELLAEYIVRTEQGEEDALARISEEHPEDASELTNRVLKWQHWQQVIGKMAQPEQITRRWGRFTLVRELGRGGMGVVYLAHDEQLDRTVALKALTTPALAGSRAATRFEREVRAAASLHHPNIVPIYEVGEQDGVPFFTMEYVEGQTLGDAIDRLRALDVSPSKLSGVHLGRTTLIDTAAAGSAEPSKDRPTDVESPTERLRVVWRENFVETICLLVLEIAEALEHAHRQGVIHRDVKPSNIMVCPDGKPQLFDFGLARTESAHSLTVSGDFVGTPQYVSPEQIAAKTTGIDHRTDIYSLGVTLFELLTLRAPFEGETTQQIFKQIVSKEPPSLRKLNSAVPRDLETICTQAMAKDAGRRYATAGDMAGDLRRFLEHRPIVARPVGPATRLLRWTQRNPAWATAWALAFLLVVGGPLTFGIHQRSAKKETDQQRVRAERNLDWALESVDRMLTRVSDQRLNDLPWAGPVRLALLEDALSLYRTLLAEQGENRVLRRRTGQAFCRLGSCLLDLGRIEEAGQAAESAIQVHEQLLSEEPGNLDHQFDLAGAVHLQALLLSESEKPAEAIASEQRAVELAAGVVAGRPADPAARIRLAYGHLLLANCQKEAGHLETAEQEFERAIEIVSKVHREFPDDPVHGEALSQMLLDQSLLLGDLGRLNESFLAERRAMEVLEQLRQNHPHWKDLRASIAMAYNNLGLHLLETGRLEEAEEALLQGQKRNQTLVEDFSNIPRYRQWLAVNHRNLGMVLFQTNRPDEAEQAFRQAVAILEELLKDHPGVLEYEGSLVVYLDELADVLIRRGLRVEAEETLDQALERAREISGENRTDMRCLALCARILNSLALLLSDQDARLEEVPPLLKEALDQQRQAIEINPDAANYRQNLRSYSDFLAETDLRLGDHRGASLAAGALARAFPGDADSLLRAAGLQARCVTAAEEDGSLDDEVRQTLATGYTQSALDLLEAAARIAPLNPAELTGNPAFAPLRDTPGFQALISRLEAKLPPEGG
ncbi:MAG: protein kinase [Planctomycetota bacterium]